MGGTHIDAVVIENGKILNIVKRSTDQKDQFNAIWETLQKLLIGYDKSKIKRINLSTTVSTNAIVEGKISAVGMIIQSGPGLPNDHLACGDENVFIDGYIDHRGKVVKDLDRQEIEQAISSFERRGIKNLAIITKFSTRNPNHEIAIRNMAKSHFSHITMGHTISGKLNFPRRVFTSYFNAAVYSTFKQFSQSIEKSLKKEGVDAPIYILKADGGTTNLDTATTKPVETILSGPAASFMGLNAMLSTQEDALLLDIGGTTTDIFFLAEGVPLFEPLGIEIASYKTVVRAIYSKSIGLGGDSAINIEDGQIRIGPKRHGNPYALGGPKPTPTDAMIVLGLTNIGDKGKARDAIKKLAFKLGLSVGMAATKIIQLMGCMIREEVHNILHYINNRPVYTIEALLHGPEIKPELIGIIGAPANALKPTLEEEFGLPCHLPSNFHVANAIGAALARPTTEITMQADTALGKLSVPEFGIYEKISKDFNLRQAKEKSLELLTKHITSTDALDEGLEPEIIEGSSFNMVKGFFTSGQNIRVRAQIKPGLIYKLWGDSND